MRYHVFSIATAMLCVAFSSQAKATPYTFLLTGSGVSGTVTLNYGTTTDPKQPAGYQITNASGSFTDTNKGLNVANASITGVQGLNIVSPETTNLLAPADFSAFAVASGLSPQENGALHYDNLFYPGGSPQTATDYPFSGGVLDIYGVLLTLNNGDVVNLWSNGVQPQVGLNYGVALVNSRTALDYVNGASLVATPEPGTLTLLGTAAIALWSRRRSMCRT